MRHSNRQLAHWLKNVHTNFVFFPTLFCFRAGCLYGTDRDRRAHGRTGKTRSAAYIMRLLRLCSGVDSMVVNVNGYVISLQQLYGIDASRRSIVISEDAGLTWLVTSTQRYAWAAGQGPDYVSAVTVPWVQGSGLTSAAPAGPYLVTGWGGMPRASHVYFHYTLVSY